MDIRFQEPRCHGSISKWIRGSIQVPATLSDAKATLCHFFEEAKLEKPEPIPSAIQLHSPPRAVVADSPPTPKRVCSPVLAGAAPQCPATPKVMCSPPRRHGQHAGSVSGDAQPDTQAKAFSIEPSSTQALTQDYNTDRDQPMHEAVDNATLKRSREAPTSECSVCFEEVALENAFIPCGHVICCQQCAHSCRVCPLCRKPIASVLRLFHG